MQKLALISLLGLTAAGSLACNNGVADRIDNRWDCKQICQRYAECFTDEDHYDVDGCAKECADNAKDDEFDDRVDACETCLDGRKSCAEDTIQCTDECAGVVAESQP